MTRKKKNSRGRYKRTDKQKKVISSSNVRRAGSRAGILGSNVYGHLIIAFLEGNNEEYDNSSIKPLGVNLNTWAQRGKREFRNAGLITYKEKKGGRGSRFKISKTAISGHILVEFKEYYSKQILPKVYDKAQRIIRQYSKTTIEKESIFTPKGKRKVKDSQRLGVFGYILETISEGNEHTRIKYDLMELEHKYAKIFEGSLKCSEQEEGAIAYHIERLKKLRKQFERRIVKSDNIKKAGEKEKEFGNILKEIKRDIDKKQSCPNEKIIKRQFEDALSFVKVKFSTYSIHDIFEEMLFQSALRYRLDEETDKYYLTAWLYQSLVLSDFTG